MELKGKIVNFLGDSITEGYGASSPDKCYVSLIEKDFGLLRANNYGVGGAQVHMQRDERHIGKSFCDRCGSMDPEADINVIFGGSNDFGRAAPIGAFEDDNIDTFCGAWHYVIQTILKNHPNAVNVICTPLHRADETSLKCGYKMEQYREIIHRMAEYYSIPLCDLWRISGIQPMVPMLRERYTIDGLHPNDAGYRLLADRIGNFLLTL